MTGNPYHQPETAAAIWNVAMNGNLWERSASQLLGLISGVDITAPEFDRLPPPLVRSFEIVLARVKCHERLRKDLMVGLQWARKASAALRDYTPERNRALRLYRIQNEDGLGPFALGVVEYARPLAEVSVTEDDSLHGAASYARANGLHAGFAARGLCGLFRWFEPEEVRKLLASGFRIVEVTHLRAIVGGEWQALVVSPHPLSTLPPVKLRPEGRAA